MPLTKQLFTKEQLPPGWVVLVAKRPNGEELATVVQIGDPDERVLNAYRTLVDVFAATAP